MIGKVIQFFDADAVKFYTAAAAGYAATLTDFTVVLKTVLLVISIGYTVHKWLKLIKEDSEKDQ